MAVFSPPAPRGDRGALSRRREVHSANQGGLPGALSAGCRSPHLQQREIHRHLIDGTDPRVRPAAVRRRRSRRGSARG